MANTYAINTTRGKEFEVEAELIALGLHPWVARRLDSKYIKEKRSVKWYDVPYIPKLMFCVFPAVYWPDVVGIKHIIGKPIVLTDRDVKGEPRKEITTRNGDVVVYPAMHGLVDFQRLVKAEYDDMARRRDNSEYECQYKPGQALEIMSGPFMGLPTEFRQAIRRAHTDYTKLRVDVNVFGRMTPLEVDPDMVKAS